MLTDNNALIGKASINLLFVTTNVHSYHCTAIQESRGSIVVKHYATNRKVAGSMPDEVIF
jgi:hypothetical protein